MQKTSRSHPQDRVALAAAIARAYVAHNAVMARDLPDLIRSVHSALTGPRPAADEAASPDQPSDTQIAASIRPEAITSFIDGRPYKTLKRHIAAHGLDPIAYRRRYGLPADYPMTAAAYSAQRSRLAKGLMPSLQLRRVGRGA